MSDFLRPLHLICVLSSISPPFSTKGTTWDISPINLSGILGSARDPYSRSPVSAEGLSSWLRSHIHKWLNLCTDLARFATPHLHSYLIESVYQPGPAPNSAPTSVYDWYTDLHPYMIDPVMGTRLLQQKGMHSWLSKRAWLPTAHPNP